MDLSEDLQERLDQYISGTMSRSEARKFEEEMEENEALKIEFMLQKNLALGISYHGNQELKNKLDGIHDEIITSDTVTEKPKWIRWSYIGVAASISILLVSYFLFFNNDSGQLYIRFYERPAFSTSRNGSVEEPTQQAGILFNNGNYQQAIKIFRTHLAKAPDDRNAKFYLGIAYLEVGKVDEAINILKSVVGSEDPFFKDRSSWFLALAYLKNKETDAAREILNLLSEDEGAGKWQELATELLRKIK